MDYFSKFLRSANSQPSPKPVHDYGAEFIQSWNLIKTTLEHPDERQLLKGISSTDVPTHLRSMVDALVWETSRAEESATGACLEHLLKNDVLGTLVRLSEPDRPSGIQAEVLRAVQNMVVLMDEQFLVHSAVHRAVLRLLRNCVGDDIQEQLDGRHKVMGAAKNAVRSQPSEYEVDLVNLLCILCSRIRTHRELLMIFFHDKHWYRSEPLFAVEEEDDDDDDEEDDSTGRSPGNDAARTPSPTPSQATITSAPVSSNARKPEYEFLLFNYLLRFVHREGQIGDFARAGLLFLMDVAMSPRDPSRFPSGDDKAEQPPPSISENPPSDPITDAALSLAEYIVDGDFSEVLGAGLGAVYSLLPSKLEICSLKASDTNENSGMVLGCTGSKSKDDAESPTDKNRIIGLEDSNSPDFKSRLDHFLKLLEFLEDIIRRNVLRDSTDREMDASALVGASIVQSILDAVRRIFLENVLYPSILECSDIDGSAVAVLSYIDIMIRTLDSGPLSDLLVDFLMSEDNEDVCIRQRPYGTLSQNADAPPLSRSAAVVDKQTKLHRRKSSAMMLLELEAPDSRRPSGYSTSVGRFTLKDLLLSNLRSHSQATVTAAIQLLQTMLSQRCRVSTNGLLLVIPDTNATSYPEPVTITPVQPLQDPGDESDDEEFVYPGAEVDSHTPRPITLFSYVQPETTYTTHEREMDLYFALVSRLDPSHNEDVFSTGYDHYLQDALAAIQHHRCFFVPPDEDPQVRSRCRHHLNTNDTILSTVLECLRRFFANTPKTNISLTGVMAELALCPDRSIAGWLTCASSDILPTIPSDDLALDDMRDDQSIDFDINEKLVTETNNLPAKRLDGASRPIVHSILQGLVDQLERYRQSVDKFDKYLLERRRGLLFSENLTDALTLALEPVANPGHTKPSAGPSTSVQLTPPRPKTKPRSSLVSFLTPRKNKSKVQALPESQTLSESDSKPAVMSNPFAPHYQQTTDILVEPFIAPLPSSSLWAPAKSSTWNVDVEDVFTDSHWGGERASAEQAAEQTEQPTTYVTLSSLLDNVVILEECIKELAAIIQARRSLGIDPLRYV
ncbi:Retinoic acid induced 16-like protein-domain-containing protein [Scleroderma yunnanense]